MILVVDDDRAIRLSLKLLLERNGYEAILAANAAEAIEAVRRNSPELVLLDMNFSRATTGDEGMILLKQIKALRPDCAVILMTAWGSIPLAVEGIHAGAFDFVTKPWNNAALLDRISTALTLASKSDASHAGAFDRSMIIGRNAALRNVLDTVRRIAPTDASVLIMGENGTGKELIAQAIHANSRRSRGPFVKVNLGGIPQSLFESEMFGHKRGAFTGAIADRIGRFEAANGGTIFLDEIGELDLNSQVKLLRVLQEHTYEMLGDSATRTTDVRVVCATNANLPKMVAEGSFREDLYYRINLITVSLPPLRDRKDDIPLLVDHLVGALCDKNSLRRPSIDSDAMDYLSSLPYPGNIRQLKNIVEGTILMSDADILRRSDFERANASAPEAMDARQCGGSLEEAQRASIERALAQSAGNISRAAALLGISRQALYRRMEKFGISI